MSPLVPDPGGRVRSCRTLDLVQSGLCSSGWGCGGGAEGLRPHCPGLASNVLPAHQPQPSSQNGRATWPGVSVSFLARTTLLSSHRPPIPNTLPETRSREGRPG